MRQIGTFSVVHVCLRHCMGSQTVGLRYGGTYQGTTSLVNHLKMPGTHVIIRAAFLLK